LWILLKAVGEKDLDVAELFNAMGNACRSKNVVAALPHYEKALYIRRRKFKDNHISVADAFDVMGDAHLFIWEFDKALEHYKKALNIKAKILGNNHPSVAASYKNLAATYRFRGDNDTAQHYEERARLIRLRSPGTNDSDLTDRFTALQIRSQEFGDDLVANDGYTSDAQGSEG